jgi:hypothetical protein
MGVVEEILEETPERRMSTITGTEHLGSGHLALATQRASEKHGTVQAPASRP